jgi:tetratricopeptide (TPR) repeat protein
MHHEFKERIRLPVIPDIVPPHVKEHPEAEAKRKASAIELNERGVKLMGEGYYTDALKSLHAAVAKDKENPTILTNAGICLFQLGKYDDALGPLEKAIKLQPDSITALYQAAMAHMQLGAPAKAIGYLDKASKLIPEGSVELKKWLDSAHDSMADHIAEQPQKYIARGDGPPGLNVSEGEAGTVFYAAHELVRSGDAAAGNKDVKRARTMWAMASEFYVAFGAAPRQLDEVGDRLKTIGEEHSAGNCWQWAASRYMAHSKSTWGHAVSGESRVDPESALSKIAEKLDGIGDQKAAAGIRDKITAWRLT